MRRARSLVRLLRSRHPSFGEERRPRRRRGSSLAEAVARGVASAALDAHDDIDLDDELGSAPTIRRPEPRQRPRRPRPCQCHAHNEAELDEDLKVSTGPGRRVLGVQVGDGLYLVGAVPTSALREARDQLGGPIKAVTHLTEKMIDTAAEAFRKRKPKADDDVSGGCARRHLCRWEPR